MTPGATPDPAMRDHVALLRAVNLVGRSRVAMAEVTALFAAVGLAGARSLLQSGNVVFDAGAHTAAALERLLETETEKRLHVRTDYFVRSAEEWKAIVAGNPFARAAKDDPSHLLVLFLKNAPSGREVKALEARIEGPERIGAAGRQLYVVYPDGIGRSKLTATAIEDAFGTRGTGRNWTTVRKLGALLRP